MATRWDWCSQTGRYRARGRRSACNAATRRLYLRRSSTLWQVLNQLISSTDAGKIKTTPHTCFCIVCIQGKGMFIARVGNPGKASMGQASHPLILALLSKLRPEEAWTCSAWQLLEDDFSLTHSLTSGYCLCFSQAGCRQAGQLVAQRYAM